MIPDMLLRLAINRLTVRPSEKQTLEELVDSEEFFRALTPALLSQILGRPIARMESRPDDLLRRAERDLSFLRARGCHALSLYDRRYPAALQEIYDPPYLLYLRGELPAIDRPMVALVGTRDPGASAAIAARTLAGEFARSGVAVVSGLARGIDVEAHLGAMEHGITGAVLASGVDLITPSAHRGVAARMLDRGGFLLSEYAPGVPPVKYHFPARNRIISGLSRAVIVLQAPAKSGALITADYALDQGRDLFVHRAGIEGARGAGSGALAADGAPIIDSASEVFREWGIEMTRDVRAPGHADRCVPEPRSAEEAARRRIELVRLSISGEASR